MQEKQYYIKAGKDQVPVNEEVFKQYQKLKRQERYQKARDRKKGLVYYDSWDETTSNGSDVCVDCCFDTAERALTAIEAEKIWHCVEKLQDEYHICRMVALGYTEREIAEILGLSQNSVHMRKKSLFRRLKKMLEKEK